MRAEPLHSLSSLPWRGFHNLSKYSQNSLSSDQTGSGATNTTTAGNEGEGDSIQEMESNGSSKKTLISLLLLLVLVSSPLCSLSQEDKEIKNKK